MFWLLRYVAFTAYLDIISIPNIKELKYHLIFVHLSITTGYRGEFSAYTLVSRMYPDFYDPCSYELEQLPSSDDGYTVQFQDLLVHTLLVCDSDS